MISSYGKNPLKALFFEYSQTKDIKIRNELIAKNMNIAEIISKKFVGKGIDYDDILQVACMGLIYAVERFDPSKGLTFATFATPTIVGEIKKFFRDKGHFIKVPRKLYELFYKAEKIRRGRFNNDSEDHTDEIAKELDISPKILRHAFEVESHGYVKSLEYEIFENEGVTFSYFLGSDDVSYSLIENKDFFERCMSALDETERYIIKRRYTDEQTQAQIARELGSSQMKVSRSEKQILAKLKKLVVER